MNEPAFLGPLRAISVIAVAAGAAGSLGFMFRVGSEQKSLLLIGLFTGWVLAPFVALVVADVLLRKRAALVRVTLCALMLMMTTASLLVYGNVALGPPRPQPAAMFLIVPPGSLVLMTIALALAMAASRDRP
jgi:ACR3 family arsenite efflux pump ArsB